MFTDIEGSTPLWEQHPHLMQAVSARHDELLKAVFEGNGGHVVKTTGDGFHVVFVSPTDGIAAALAGQQALATEAWPPGVGSIKESMDLLANCTAVADEPGKNDLYRQLFNILPEKRAEIVDQLCTPEQAQPVLAKMETMGPEDVNEVVKRLHIADFRSTSPFARTQFNCNEAFPFGQSSQTLAEKMREAGMPQFLIDEGEGTIDQATETCQIWPSGISSPFEIEPVGASYRALLLNGQWDYVTYPKWAKAVHQRWSASEYAFIPNGMHSLLSNYGDCPTNITLQFLNEPDQPVDMSCTQEMTIEWILP